MSDEKLRGLERRWRASGTVEDEAAYLRERLRVGDLSQERLELAAYLGWEPACVALGERPAPWLPTSSGIASIELLHGLQTRFGPEVLARAQEAAAGSYSTVDRIRGRVGRSFMPTWIPFRASRSYRARMWIGTKIVGSVRRDVQKVEAIVGQLVPWALGDQDSEVAGGE